MSFEHLLTFKFKYLIDRIDPEAGGNIMGDVITLVEKILIQLALEKTGHKLGQSAALLGINRNTLRKKIQVLGLETKDS
ncbi:MAG: Fis family transcriptional regulator [Deltaproteobacteria bacterium]|nr:Fis family transcriptional regulator [Deltaproteobacteria bacterium]